MFLGKYELRTETESGKYRRFGFSFSEKNIQNKMRYFYLKIVELDSHRNREGNKIKMIKDGAFRFTSEKRNMKRNSQIF